LLVHGLSMEITVVKESLAEDTPDHWCTRRCFKAYKTYTPRNANPWVMLTTTGYTTLAIASMCRCHLLLAGDDADKGIADVSPWIVDGCGSAQQGRTQAYPFYGLCLPRYRSES